MDNKKKRKKKINLNIQSFYANCKRPESRVIDIQSLGKFKFIHRENKLKQKKIDDAIWNIQNEIMLEKNYLYTFEYRYDKF